jgi:hypothetical protein
MDKRYKFTGSEDIRELLAKSCEGYGNWCNQNQMLC